MADTGSTDTSYTDADATEPGELYVYRVKALRGGEKSGRSNHVNVDIPEAEPEPTPKPTPSAPAQPTGLNAAATHDSVALSLGRPPGPEHHRLPNPAPLPRRLELRRW